MPGPSDFVTAGFLLSALSYGGGVALLLTQKLLARGSALVEALAGFSVQGAAALVIWRLTAAGEAVLVALAVSLATSLAARRLLRHFIGGGQVLLASQILLMLFALLWGIWFILTIPVSATTRALILLGAPLLALTMPAGLVGQFEQLEVLCRTRWFRPRGPLSPKPRQRYPKVSIHVPAYAEPPDLVMATLDALARLCYPNFEVLVIDNNTKDASLWQPVEVYCRQLGERFRFFHVAPLTGAKAGALNYALRQTAPDAGLIAVIDSDYQPEPDFLPALVGFFDDPRIGFVQTPHDYRDWEASPYQRMCYWEYESHYKNTMASLNERDAAYTIGTMCLIRRSALEEAGGWAEWCLTEDSEVAIRIHALGYTGVYLTTTFGHGVIPETFEGYKRQRFRWTYGPVQELKHPSPAPAPPPIRSLLCSDGSAKDSRAKPCAQSCQLGSGAAADARSAGRCRIHGLPPGTRGGPRRTLGGRRCAAASGVRPSVARLPCSPPLLVGGHARSVSGQHGPRFHHLVGGACVLVGSPGRLAPNKQIHRAPSRPGGPQHRPGGAGVGPSVSLRRCEHRGDLPSVRPPSPARRWPLAPGRDIPYGPCPCAPR